MSLKLSQYSYKPTYGEFKRNETEIESSNMMNNSGYREVIDTSMYGEKSTFKKANDVSRNDKSSVDDISNSDAQKNYFNSSSKADFQDNLNNGMYRMEMSP